MCCLWRQFSREHCAPAPRQPNGWNITDRVKLFFFYFFFFLTRICKFLFRKHYTSNRLGCIISTSECFIHSRDVHPWNKATANQCFKMLPLIFRKQHPLTWQHPVSIVKCSLWSSLLPGNSQHCAQTVKTHTSQHSIVFKSSANFETWLNKVPSSFSLCKIHKSTHILLFVPLKKGNLRVCICIGQWRRCMLQEGFFFSCEIKK